jgi:NADH dehydrogenase
MSRPVPPRAQSAQQQANYLVKALAAHIANKPLPVYKYSDFGSLISLSEGNSVGSLVGNINVKGRIARLMYVMLYRMHQYSLHGFFKTLMLWSKDQLSKSSSPTLKLH